MAVVRHVGVPLEGTRSKVMALVGGEEGFGDEEMGRFASAMASLLYRIRGLLLNKVSRGGDDLQLCPLPSTRNLPSFDHFRTSPQRLLPCIT